MLKILTATATLLLSTQAFAGAANAIINCKSATGRSLFVGEFPVDMTTASMTVTVDGKSQPFINDAMVEDAQLNKRSLDAEYPNYNASTISTKRSNTGLTMKAHFGDEATASLSLVSTGRLTVTRGAYGAEKIQFKALLNGVDPRTGGNSFLPQITVRCSYNYSI